MYGVAARNCVYGVAAPADARKQLLEMMRFGAGIITKETYINVFYTSLLYVSFCVFCLENYFCSRCQEAAARDDALRRWYHNKGDLH